MKNRKIAGLFFSLIFLFGAIGLNFVMYFNYNLTEENTVEFTATIKNIDTANTGALSDVKIYVEEYNMPLYMTSTLCESIDLYEISNLETGDKVHFRVEKNTAQQIEKNNIFCPIVSLKTTEKEILSLNSYNKYMRDASFPARIAAIIITIFFLLMIIHFVFLLKGINIFKNLKKNSQK